MKGHIKANLVRLPVAHCTLNPTELAWAQVKGHIKANAKHFNLTETKKLAWDGFAVMTPDRWKKLIRHVREKKVKDHYWPCHRLYQQSTQQFIIQFGEVDSDSDGGTSGEETCTTDCDDGTSEEEITWGCDCVNGIFSHNGFSKATTAFMKATMALVKAKRILTCECLPVIKNWVCDFTHKRKLHVYHTMYLGVNAVYRKCTAS